MVYRYESNGIPIFHYPYGDTNCLVKTETNQRIHFACPGPVPGILILVGNRNYAIATKSVYILNGDSFYEYDTTRFHGAPISFEHIALVHLKCVNNVLPVMIKNERRLRKENFYLRDKYEVGFRLNDIDIVKVYDIMVFEDERIETHIRIPSVIKTKSDFLVENKYRWGSFDSSKALNFTELYSWEYQQSVFQKLYNNLELTKKYFSGTVQFLAHVYKKSININLI